MSALDDVSHALAARATQRYTLRLGLRVVILALVFFALAADFPLFTLAAALGSAVFYVLSIVVRPRSAVAADALLTLGDLPALTAVVHLTPHELGYEALVPAWLVGVTFINLRRGNPTLLPVHVVAAWLVLASHAPTTLTPWRYLGVQSLVIALATVVALAMVLERRRHRSDELTGVLARRAGLGELYGLLQKQPEIAIAFVDLRGFKRINDLHGHRIGDEVLAVVAERLSGVIRRSDVLFRYGGDEFIAASASADLAERLKGAFELPVQTGSGTIQVDARIGVMRAHASTSLNDIVQEADRRMYADRGNDRAAEH